MRPRQRPTSSRAIRTWADCSRPARRRPNRSSQTPRSSAPSGTAGSDSSSLQVPAQPLLGPPPLVDQVVAVVDQQLQLAQALLTRPRMIEPRLAQRRPGDRECVDRVRLAARAASTALRRHQLRRHPHQRLARLQQRPLERPGQLSAVLNSPGALARQRARPGEQLAGGRGRRLRQRASGLVDGDSRQRLLVHVHSDHDHSDRLLQRRGRPASGQTSIEAAAKLLSGHARRSREGGGDTTLASQPTGRHAGIESAAADPSLRRRSDATTPEPDIEFGNVPR